jgi:hypothetical protein
MIFTLKSVNWWILSAFSPVENLFVKSCLFSRKFRMNYSLTKYNFLMHFNLILGNYKHFFSVDTNRPKVFLYFQKYI